VRRLIERKEVDLLVIIVDLIVRITNIFSIDLENLYL